MDIQVINFLKILNAAIDNDRKELSDPDWNKLYGYAVQHSLTPIFYEGCNKYNEYYCAPEKLKNTLLGESVEMVMFQARKTDAFLYVYEKLVAAGIKPLVLKGLVCRNTYGELEDHRYSGDEDIYIKVDEFQSCREILIHSGFIMEDMIITDKLLSETQHISFFNTESELCIEVHLSLMGNINNFRKRINAYFQDAFDTSISYEINGHQIYTLNHTQHFLFLFFHFYKHFTASGVGIRQMLDILMYDKNYHDEIHWKVIEESIREMSAGYLFSDVIALGNQYLGFNLTTKFKGYNKEALLEDTMETGIFGNSTRVQVMSGRITSAALERSNNNILRYMFPKVSVLNISHPILLDKPYLLPFIWIKRIIKFLLKKETSKGKLVVDSMTIGKRRIQLLQKYSII